MKTQLSDYIQQAVAAIRAWEEGFGSYAPHPSLSLEAADVEAALATYTERLSGNYPFFHPRYAGQMLKPPHPVAVVGYLAAMLINPNNHALDGGPPTSEMEKEVMEQLRLMFDLPHPALGHLTSSGTIANLEALWVARELHPGRAVLYSDEAHYTHRRMCGVLGIESRSVPTNEYGEMDVESLERELARGDVGAVVATAGTTGSGAVDDIPTILNLCREREISVHVDAAYGGFFRSLIRRNVLEMETEKRLAAISECDSVVVDPHKHGLQPYGCGAVLFRDPGVGRFYRHDSPYTYFTSDELHLGEISLECSRAGAAAGALWLTLQVLPLDSPRGLPAVLSATRSAATSLADRLEQSNFFDLLRMPALDIVTFYPRHRRASDVDRISATLFRRLMDDRGDPLYLSVLKVDTAGLAGRGIEPDVSEARVLRSVLMKPEHEHSIDWMIRRLEDEMTRMEAENE